MLENVDFVASLATVQLSLSSVFEFLWVFSLITVVQIVILKHNNL